MNSSSTRHAPSFSAETFTSCSLPPAIQKDSDGLQICKQRRRQERGYAQNFLCRCYHVTVLQDLHALPFCSSQSNPKVKRGQIETKLQLKIQIKLVNLKDGRQHLKSSVNM